MFDQLTLIRPGGGGGGGGVESTPLDVSHDNFFRVLRNFWRYFRKNQAYRSEVTQRYVTEHRLKIWKFLDLCTKHIYGKWRFVLKINFGL